MTLDHDKYILSPAAYKTGVPMQLSSIDQITNKKSCVSIVQNNSASACREIFVFDYNMTIFIVINAHFIQQK